MVMGKKGWMTALILLLLVGTVTAATTEQRVEQLVEGKSIAKENFIIIFLLEILIAFIVIFILAYIYYHFFEKKRLGVRSKSIRTKIIVYFMSVGIFLSILTFAMNTYVMTLPLSDEVDNHLENLAISTEGHLETFIQDKVDKLKLISGDETVLRALADEFSGGDQDDTASGLEKKLQLMGDLERFFLISEEGNIVLSTNDSYMGRNVEGRNYFNLGLRDFGAMIGYEDGIPKLFIYGPFDEKGVGVAVLGTEKLVGILDIGEEIGESGEAELVFRGDDGLPRIITSREYDTYRRSGLLYDSLDGIEELHKGVTDFRGNEVISATRYLDKFDMGLVVKIGENEAFDEHRTMILEVATLITILLVILIIAGSYVLSNNITGPVKKIIEGAKEIEDGKFDKEVVVNTGDELELLANTFNNTKKALKNIQKEREDIDRMKTKFLSITSHELRSPMTPMRAQLQMILNGYFGKLTKKQRESLDIVLRNTTRLDKIIMDFLEVSRIEAARLKFHFQKTNVEEVIDSIVSEMEAFMPEKKIKLVKKLDPLPIVELDPDRLGQVLRNLINNAIKFTPENGTIEISAKLRSKDILFYVRDTGIGISKEAQVRIFEPFYQEENSMYRKYSGTGLGLAIIRGIVESQEGKLWLQSTKDVGTTFYFTVPLKPVREVKSVQLLYSNKVKKESQLKETFERILGPMGEKEFDMLLDKGDISAEDLGYYVDYLLSEGIISEEKGKDLLDSIARITKDTNFQKRGK